VVLVFTALWADVSAAQLLFWRNTVSLCHFWRKLVAKATLQQ
jgi:hypothetical protein